MLDTDGDGEFDAVEVYEVDEETGGVKYDMPNYDPDNSNPDAVVGDPEEAMEEWNIRDRKRL